MGIWDRLGNVIKSYINNDSESITGGNRGRSAGGDSDYNAAYEELEGFLKGEKADFDDAFNAEFRTETGGKKNNTNSTGANKNGAKPGRPVPFELKADFAELGLGPDATENECKEAYKKLLFIHHPDRHTGDPEQMKKATEKTARINAAYDRLTKWFKENN
ncbi:MAG: J domain-containing protein [Treponema sp.]|nr:J domain-containing protein [Treponema sp.]